MCVYILYIYYSFVYKRLLKNIPVVVLVYFEFIGSLANKFNSLVSFCMRILKTSTLILDFFFHLFLVVVFHKIPRNSWDDVNKMKKDDH
jgi:hypothetical protein